MLNALRLQRCALTRPVVVMLVLVCVLSGCGSDIVAPAAYSPVASTPTAPAALATNCPQADQPPLQSGATLTLQPSSGSVGTQVNVQVNGLQPGCHLWLGMTVGPALSETGGSPLPAPRTTAGALQWIAVSSAGDVRTTMCVCPSIFSYVLGYPPYPSATPPPAPGGNVQVYAPRAGDYFFVTIAGATITDPPPLYARFSVTQ